MAGQHLGGRNIGSPTIAAGLQTRNLDNIDIHGCAHGMDVIVAGSLISTGAAFNAKNPTGANKLARGADDLDKLLDFVFANLTLRIDENQRLFESELASRLRAVLSAMTGQDFGVTGALVDGTSIPLSTGAPIPFSVRMRIPFSLREEVFEEDGDAYKIGTKRLVKGAFLPNFANVAGAVALVNGSATLSGLTVSLVPHIDIQDDPFYVGPTYKIETNPTLPSEVTTQLRRAKRIFLFVDGTTAGPYTIKGDIWTDTLDAASFIDAYNQNRRARGGDNTTAKVVPLIWPRRMISVHELDLTPSVPYVKDTSAPASQTLISVTHEPALDSVVARVGTDAATEKGGTVARYVPTPKTAHGNSVHPKNASLLGGGFVKVR